MVPHRPESGIFLAESPEDEGPQPHLPRGAHFIQRRDAIEKPDLVALMAVFVVIGEVGVQFVALEMHVRLGVGCFLPDLLHGQVAGVDNFELGARLGDAFLRQLLRPVIAVVAHGADDLLFWHRLQHAAKVALKPVLRGDWSRIAA